MKLSGRDIALILAGAAGASIALLARQPDEAPAPPPAISAPAAAAPAEPADDAKSARRAKALATAHELKGELDRQRAARKKGSGADVVRAAAVAAQQQTAAEQAAEIERLRAQVTALEKALEDEQDIRAEREGEAFEFPEDLPEDFTEDALKGAFAETFDAIGLDGSVESIDCSEFPCIVYGDATTADGKSMQEQFEALNGSLKERYGEDTGIHASVWSGEEVDEETGEAVRSNRFAFAVYPQDVVPEEQRTDLQKRLNFRQSESRKARQAAEGQ